MCWRALVGWMCPGGAGALHRGQAGTDRVPRSVPAPKTSTRHREAAPAPFIRHTKPFLGCHTLQSPHCCCHRVPGTPAREGPAWMAFLGEKKAFLVWRAPQRLTSLCSASLCKSQQFLATLQLLQPFFISLGWAGPALQPPSFGVSWEQGSPQPWALLGGPGAAPQGRQGGLAHPVAAPQAFGRDAANSNCNFHSGGCAPQAKSLLSL